MKATTNYQNPIKMNTKLKGAMKGNRNKLQKHLGFSGKQTKIGI